MVGWHLRNGGCTRLMVGWSLGNLLDFHGFVGPLSKQIFFNYVFWELELGVHPSPAACRLSVYLCTASKHTLWVSDLCVHWVAYLLVAVDGNLAVCVVGYIHVPHG